MNEWKKAQFLYVCTVIDHLRYILSGGSILSTCGAGWFWSGIRSVFLGGIPSLGSLLVSILSSPLVNVLMALTQASFVEYTKLPSIQEVIRLIWEGKEREKQSWITKKERNQSVLCPSNNESSSGTKSLGSGLDFQLHF